MPCTPVPPVSPLIESAGTQLQGGQPDRQTRAPLTPRRTVFLVGQCHRKTNPYQCSIAVDTSSDDICRNKSFNTHCGIGRRVNLAKKEVKWWVTTTSLLRTGYECTSRRIGQAARNGVLTSTTKLTGLREYCSTGKFSWIETSKLRLNSTPTLEMRTGIEKG